MSAQPNPFDEKLRVLVAVEVPDPEQISPLLIELYRPLRVCLLGTYRVPEQTAPEQAREQAGPEADEALEDVADAFRDQDVEVDTELVFTPEPFETLERTAVEKGCHAVLLMRPAYELDRILAALRPGPVATRVLRFLAELLRGTGYRATLLYVATGQGDPEDARRQLELLRRELTEEDDIDPERVDVRLVTEGDREDVVVAAAREHGVVLIGETEPTIRDRIFGDFAERLADATDTPVMVVRREV